MLPRLKWFCAILTMLAFAKLYFPALHSAEVSNGQLPEALPASGRAIDCPNNSHCDNTTGCAVPNFGTGIPKSTLDLMISSDSKLVSDLVWFKKCRETQTQKQRQFSIKRNLEKFDDDFAEWAKQIASINESHLWAPASVTDDTITKFGDEARAVFGEIPDFSCQSENAVVIPTTRDGHKLDLERNPNKIGAPFEFSVRRPDGKIVEWLERVDKCDKPSLAGGLTYCGINSRIQRQVRGNVEWITLCRKSIGEELTVDPSWSSNSSLFSLLGIIGYNSLSGEVVFFDGRRNTVFNWNNPFPPPGGHSYEDTSGRTQASALYDPLFSVQCSACHDNKEPHTIDPHMMQRRVGFNEFGETGLDSALDNIPRVKRTAAHPFRVIGSAYTATHKSYINSARIIQDPSGSCTKCHTLTNSVTGRRLAADATGKQPHSGMAVGDDALEMIEEQKEFHRVDQHRTDWAKHVSRGAIYPWMFPEDGGSVGNWGIPISDESWSKLSDCVWSNSGQNCGYRKVYTECLSPEDNGDTTAQFPELGELGSIQKLEAALIENPTGRSGRVTWEYKNALGGVPDRDDVRFDVVLQPLRLNHGSPADMSALFQKIEMRLGSQVADNVFSLDGEALLTNVSEFDRKRFSSPLPSARARSYQVEFPVESGREYRIIVAPKRFCFDQEVNRYSSKLHTLYLKVPSN